MVKSTRRLLVLSCTRRKRLDDGLLPAIERYDGPTFRVLRRYLAGTLSNPPTTYVVSAEHGLINGDQPIAWYERTMTPERTDQLREALARDLTDAIDRLRPTSAMMLMGQRYARVLTGIERSVTLSAAQFVGGSPGRQVAVLHDWLYGTPPALAPSRAVERSWRGVLLPTSREGLLAATRDALGRWSGAVPIVNSWYVEIDRQHVPLKWLLSQLTGLPVGSFHSSDARRVLGHLGVEVRRA